MRIFAITLLLFVSFTSVSYAAHDADTNQARARAQSAKENAEARREAMQQSIEARKSMAETSSRERRENFLQKVAEIQDERKRRIVTNLSSRLSAVNDRWVTHWVAVLTRFEDILEKMTVRADVLANEGHNVAQIKSAIGEASLAISEAKESVRAQAGKVYVIDIQEETTIGQSVQTLTSIFRSDLKETLGYVRAAREAMVAALSSMKSLSVDDGHGGGEDNGNDE
jgi:hypothetical protein